MESSEQKKLGRRREAMALFRAGDLSKGEHHFFEILYFNSPANGQRVGENSTNAMEIGAEAQVSLCTSQRFLRKLRALGLIAYETGHKQKWELFVNKSEKLSAPSKDSDKEVQAPTPVPTEVRATVRAVTPVPLDSTNTPNSIASNDNPATSQNDIELRVKREENTEDPDPERARAREEETTPLRSGEKQGEQEQGSCTEITGKGQAKEPSEESPNRYHNHHRKYSPGKSKDRGATDRRAGPTRYVFARAGDYICRRAKAYHATSQ